MKRKTLLPLLVILFSGSTIPARDILIADFEGETYGEGWTLTGTAFSSRPVTRDTTRQKKKKVSGYLGKGYVNSYNPNDRATGTLLSPAFKIKLPYISFLIGGGKHPGETCINLIIDGQVVRSATGPSSVSRDDETLRPFAWDVASLIGKNAQIQIVDSYRGGWGHINIDHIMQTDEKPHNIASLPEEGIQAKLPQNHILTNLTKTPSGDLLIADFEGGAYDKGWTTTGTAFGDKPKTRTSTRQKKNIPSGYLGEGYVNSYHPNDRATGVLSSPLFNIEKPYIRFLIGGGGHAGLTCINLLVDGEIVRTATGPNVAPGGEETLAPGGWDTAPFIGKNAQIQIIDRHRGGWGHINIDHIVQTDRKPENIFSGEIIHPEMSVITKSLLIDKPYLYIPIKNGQPTATVLIHNPDTGEKLRQFDVNLATTPHSTDWCNTLDLSPFLGKTLSLTVDPIDSSGFSRDILDKLKLTSVPYKASTDNYDHPQRPQLHFTPENGWVNDPNGMVYHKGLWHLFFQYNPYGNTSRNKHWGHAISKDLIRWEELPVAIHAYTHGATIGQVYSGSAIIDHNNTAGFGKDAMIAVYTDTATDINKRHEVLAYSLDEGRTFTYYEGNPAIIHRGRDPKAFWYEKDKCWVIVVFDENEGKRNFSIYTSPDLKTWTFRSRLLGLYECPEFFELPVLDATGKPTGEYRWVMTEANAEYYIGAFDGKTFQPENQDKYRWAYSRYPYAMQTFNNAPDARRIGVAWIRATSRNTSFSGAQSIPMELTLRPTSEGIRLHSWPVKEFESLRRGDPIRKERRAISDQAPVPLLENAPQLLDISLSFTPSDSEPTVFLINGNPLTYNPSDKTLAYGAQSSPLSPLPDGKISLRLILDRTIIAMFANEGLVYMPLKASPPPSKTSLAIQGKGSILHNLEAFPLQSIWDK